MYSVHIALDVIQSKTKVQDTKKMGGGKLLKGKKGKKGKKYRCASGMLVVVFGVVDRYLRRRGCYGNSGLM